jgi:hypothetical protein
MLRMNLPPCRAPCGGIPRVRRTALYGRRAGIPRPGLRRRGARRHKQVARLDRVVLATRRGIACLYRAGDNPARQDVHRLGRGARARAPLRTAPPAQPEAILRGRGHPTMAEVKAGITIILRCTSVLAMPSERLLADGRGFTRVGRTGRLDHMKRHRASPHDDAPSSRVLPLPKSVRSVRNERSLPFIDWAVRDRDCAIQTAAGKFADDYVSTLQRHLTSTGAGRLGEACRFGEAARHAGISIRELAALHHRSAPRPRNLTAPRSWRSSTSVAPRVWSDMRSVAV